MNSDMINAFKSCGLSAAEFYDAFERLRLIGIKVGPYSEAELKARKENRIRILEI